MIRRAAYRATSVVFLLLAILCGLIAVAGIHLQFLSAGGFSLGLSIISAWMVLLGAFMWHAGRGAWRLARS